MAEEESDLESERFKEELESLLGLCKNDDQGLKSKNYCSRFCQLVEEHTGRWQVPLPQLQVLQTALCYFTHGTATFPPDCEHVQFALGSLALSFFELLLFFGKDEFLEEPLKDIIDSFQDCFAGLLRHKNVYLLLVNQIIQTGGPWENSVLQAILKESVQSPDEVKKYLDSEVPVFFELRVRYLLACERIQEAGALAKACLRHPEMGRQLYFHQVHLTCLWKASLFDQLRLEMAEINGRDAVEILCNAEEEEKNDLLLDFSRIFLTQQLQGGHMAHVWDLVFLWSKLHLRANPSKQDFIEECRQLMMSVTTVTSIFPFLKVIRDEVGNEGLHFCVELCARALHMNLHHDPVTKSLIYKTIAYLFPNDLEVCRACALLVFFLERTVDSYKTVYLLYTHPDQEYHVDSSLVKNHVRFEILQILKKGLFFDPEFWNLINLRKNCLKLMSEKVMKAALKEIMEEDKWIPNYCAKEQYEQHSDTTGCNTIQVASRHAKDRSKPDHEKQAQVLEEAVAPPVKRRGRKPGPRAQKPVGDCQLRRSFRQLNMTQENANRQHKSRQRRHLVRQLENTSLKRRGRKPRWMLQEAARQAENGALRRRSSLEKKMKSIPAGEKLLEHGTGKTDKKMEMSQEVLLDPREDGGLTHYVTPRDAADEFIQTGEQSSSVSTELLSDNERVIPVQGTMLEFSLPDNEFMDSLFMDQDAETSEYRVQQNSTWGDNFSTQKAAVEHPLCKNTELCKGDADPSLLIQRQSEISELKAEVCEELAIELHIATIQELHNYSRILEETSEVCLQSLPEAPSPMQQEEHCNTRKLEMGLLEKHSISFQTSVGMEVHSPVQANITKSSVSASEGVSFEDSTQAYESCEIPVQQEVPSLSGTEEKTVPNGCISDLWGLDSTVDHVGATLENTDFALESIKSRADSNTVNVTHMSTVSSKTDCVCSSPNHTQVQVQPSEVSETEDAGLEASESPSALLHSTPPKVGHPVLKHRCMVCNKEFRGGNIMRHAVAHLQRDKLKCMFCSKEFRCRLKAKRHVADHVEKIKNASSNGPVCDRTVSPTTEDTVPLCRKVLHSKLKDIDHQEGLTESRAKLKANGSIEADDVQGEKGEFRCPADGCEKMFARAQWSLIRHAMKFHPNDDKVLEYTFSSRKGHCHFCKRKFLSLPHYQDHIRGHNYPLKHACLHHDCKQRFKSLVELRGHMRSHQPFQAQCSFSGCLRRFGHLGQLFEHELRHYQLPKMKDAAMEAASEVWTVRGKREEGSQDACNRGYVWRSPLHHRSDVPDNGCKAFESAMATNGENQGVPSGSDRPVLSEFSSDVESSVDMQLVNGHGKNDGDAEASNQIEWNSESLESRLDSQSVDHTAQQEPAAKGRSTAKPDERSQYGGTSNKPFVRLPASAYLDEKYISMPKRRKPSAAPSSFSVQQQMNRSDGAQRQRCGNCFVTFASVEELKSHLSSNKCVSLFGFESDEEGA